MILYGSLQAKTIKNNKNQDKQYTVPTRPGFHQTYLWQFPVDFVASPWAKMQICCPAGSKRTWPGHLRAVYLPKRFREKHLHDVLLNQYTSIISSVNVTSQDGNFEGWVRVIFFGQSVQRISPFSPAFMLPTRVLFGSMKHAKGSGGFALSTAASILLAGLSSRMSFSNCSCWSLSAIVIHSVFLGRGPPVHRGSQRVFFLGTFRRIQTLQERKRKTTAPE